MEIASELQTNSRLRAGFTTSVSMLPALRRAYSPAEEGIPAEGPGASVQDPRHTSSCRGGIPKESPEGESTEAKSEGKCT